VQVPASSQGGQGSRGEGGREIYGSQYWAQGLRKTRKNTQGDLEEGKGEDTGGVDDEGKHRSCGAKSGQLDDTKRPEKEKNLK